MNEPLPAGTNAIVDEAMDEAAQSLFSAAGVPMACTDELLAAVQGPAVRAVLEARIEQIVKHGHSVESDLDLPIGWLPDKVRTTAMAAAEVLSGLNPHRDLRLARRRMVVAVAIGLAAIDVLDATITAEGGQ